MQSAVVYDAVYDIRMIKKKENTATVRLLAAIKDTKNSQDTNCQKYIKMSRHTAILKL